MSAALALETEELQSFIQRPQFEIVSSVPEAIVLSEIAEDEVIRQKVVHFAGECALSQAVSLEYVPSSPVNSLFEAIKLNIEEVVETNVRTDIVERTLKSGHITEVELVVEDGVIHQGGQSLLSIQANNLLFTAGSEKMLDRSMAETRNAFRIMEAYDNGQLEDNSVVVISRAADDMTKQEMEDVGFFTDTMSVSIQVTRKVEDKLVTESAFVAGVAKPGQERHDAETIVALGDVLGVDLRGKNAAELIDAPLLVPNTIMPNGVIDLVELYDSCAEEDVFFGEAKPIQDYHEYREQCRERERALQPVVADIVTELFDRSSQISDEVEACKTLAKLSEKYMVVQAVNDKTINPLVFGKTAARYIYDARHFIEIGEHERAVGAVTQAQTTAISSSCPSALKAKLANNSQQEGESSNKEADADDYGSLVFTCENGHLNRRPPNRLIDRCRTCGVSVRC